MTPDEIQNSINAQLFVPEILKSKNTSRLEFLLEAGADVKALGPTKCTLLHLAATLGRRDVIDLLLAVGGKDIIAEKDVIGIDVVGLAYHSPDKTLSAYLIGVYEGEIACPTPESVGIDLANIEANRSALLDSLQIKEPQLSGIGAKEVKTVEIDG